MQWLLKIRYEVTESGGFLNGSEAANFIAAYTFKHAEQAIKPDSYAIKFPTSRDECHVFYFLILTYKREFPDLSDFILWVDEVEQGLGTFFTGHGDVFRNANIVRRGHETSQLRTE